MKSKIWKILAIAMTAATIACVGAGCAKNDKKDQASSSTSAASSKDASKSDSKTESSEASKAASSEASKTESKTEKSSKAEESKTEESKTEESKAEESKTESAEESTEESKESETADSFVGMWEYNIGNMYIGLIVNDDNTAVIKDINGNAVSANWTVEDGILCVSIGDDIQKFEYVDGQLKDPDEGHVLVPVKNLSVDMATIENDDTDAYIGTWEYTVGGDYAALVINPDGTAEMKDEDGNTVFSARWTLENGTLYVRAAGGLERFTLVDGHLEDVDNRHFYTKAADLADE